MFHEIRQIERVIFHIKLAGGYRNIPRIVPIRNPDFAIFQKALHCGAQQGCIVPGHWRDQQNPALHIFTPQHVEADQITEGTFNLSLYLNQVILPVCAYD